MHEDTSHERFCADVAAYIDERDPHALQHDWPPQRFAEITVHVLWCVDCLELRVDNLRKWGSPGPPDRDVHQ